MAGSYEALTAGETGEALVDFTGGVNEMITLSWSSYESDDTKQQELFHKMEHAHKHKSLITCSVWVCTINKDDAHDYCLSYIVLDYNHRLYILKIYASIL